MLQLLLGQIPEAIYFALFIILTKSYKNKRILFIVLSIIEYILLLNLFPYSTWSHISYFALMYVIMNMTQLSNDDLMRHLIEQDKVLEEQTNDYLKKIVEQNEKIIELLKNK